MPATTLTRPQPVSFTPLGNRGRRLSRLDPRPLWLEPAAVASPWQSPGFWAACAIVLPAAAAARLGRAILRIF